MNELLRPFENGKNIMIAGETGVGKSVYARNLHNQSIHKNSAFIQLNVASLSSPLFESELFGHKKGAFTSAVSDKIGFAEQVGSGTLFIDEIGSLSLSSQAKLLTLIEEKLFYPVGSAVARTFRGRLIFATNEDLLTLVKKGEFREDLYFRINVFFKKLPPLREVLTSTFIREILAKNEEVKKSSKVFSHSAIEELLKVPWRGNYREFNNCIENLIYQIENSVINATHVKKWYELRYGNEADLSNEIITTYHEQMDKFEEELIRRGLRANLGRVNQTSRYLQLNKTTLIAKMKKYAINTSNLNIALS